MFYSKILILVLITFVGHIALADPPGSRSATQCPVDVRLKSEEKRALRIFNDRMEGLLSHYGRNSMPAALASIVEREYPDKRVIEVSPAFYEHALHYIDFAYVFNDIEMTIGKNHSLWSRTGDFRRYRDKVMSGHHNGLRTWERERFDAATENIIDVIQNLTPSQMRKRGLTQEETDIIKSRAMTGIINTYMIVGQWDEIYKAIQAENARWMRDMALEIGLFALTGFALPGGLFVWTTIKAASLMQKTARLAVATSRSSGLVAARVTTMSDVFMASGLGAVGAPAGLRILDASGAVAESIRVSRNTDTILICQLGRQINALNARGLAPYFKAAVIGGTVGAAGAGITAISPAFARAVLEVTRYGVFVAQGYSIYSFGSSTVYSIQEFGYAQDAIENGDRDLALQHLRLAREHAVHANDAFMNALLLSLLTTQIQGNYSQVVSKMKIAMGMAAVEIRALYASSADTLPTAMENAMAAVQDVNQYLASLKD